MRKENVYYTHTDGIWTLTCIGMMWLGPVDNRQSSGYEFASHHGHHLLMLGTKLHTLLTRQNLCGGTKIQSELTLISPGYFDEAE